MRILAVGIGGAGSRIVDQLYYQDKRSSVSCMTSVVVDTDGNFLAQLRSLPNDAKLFFPALDPDVHYDVKSTVDVDAILAKLKGIQSFDVDAIMIFIGLGGSMSVILPQLVEEIRKTYFEPVFAVCTLPYLREGHNVAKKAADSLDEIKEYVDGIILFDNETWFKKIKASFETTLDEHGLPITKPSPYGKAMPNNPRDIYYLLNERISNQIGLLLRAGEFNERGIESAEIVLDAGEILNTLKGNGMTAIGYAIESVPFNLFESFEKWRSESYFSEGSQKRATRIVGLAKQAVYEEISVPCDLTSADKALILIAGPSKELSMKGFQTVRKWIDTSIAGLEMRCGDYPVKNMRSVCIIIMLSGLHNIPRVEEIKKLRDEIVGEAKRKELEEENMRTLDEEEDFFLSGKMGTSKKDEIIEADLEDFEFASDPITQPMSQPVSQPINQPLTQQAPVISPEQSQFQSQQVQQMQQQQVPIQNMYQQNIPPQQQMQQQQMQQTQQQPQVSQIQQIPQIQQQPPQVQTQNTYQQFAPQQIPQQQMQPQMQQMPQIQSQQPQQVQNPNMYQQFAPQQFPQQMPQQQTQPQMQQVPIQNMYGQPVSQQQFAQNQVYQQPQVQNTAPQYSNEQAIEDEAWGLIDGISSVPPKQPAFNRNPILDVSESVFGSDDPFADSFSSAFGSSQSKVENFELDDFLEEESGLDDEEEKSSGAVFYTEAIEKNTAQLAFAELLDEDDTNDYGLKGAGEAKTATFSNIAMSYIDDEEEDSNDDETLPLTSPEYVKEQEHKEYAEDLKSSSSALGGGSLGSGSSDPELAGLRDDKIVLGGIAGDKGEEKKKNTIDLGLPGRAGKADLDMTRMTVVNFGSSPKDSSLATREVRNDHFHDKRDVCSVGEGAFVLDGKGDDNEGSGINGRADKHGDVCSVGETISIGSGGDSKRRGSGPNDSSLSAQGRMGASSKSFGVNDSSLSAGGILSAPKGFKPNDAAFSGRISGSKQSFKPNDSSIGGGFSIKPNILPKDKLVGGKVAMGSSAKKPVELLSSGIKSSSGIRPPKELLSGGMRDNKGVKPKELLSGAVRGGNAGVKPKEFLDGGVKVGSRADLGKNDAPSPIKMQKNPLDSGKSSNLGRPKPAPTATAAKKPVTGRSGSKGSSDDDDMLWI